MKRRPSDERSPSPSQALEVQFVEPCPDDLQCQICFSVAREAVVTDECGHLFCQICIATALEIKPQCPMDRNPLTWQQVRKDVRTQRRIAALQCYCFHKGHGCTWVGEFGDLESHTEKCEHSPVDCTFAPHGCDAVVTKRNLAEHIATNVVSHLSLISRSMATLMDDNVAQQQELELCRREDRFIWVIPRFENRQGPLYSRKFCAKGLQWYIGVDFESPDEHAGVYLFAEGHSRRVDFKLILYNADPKKDKIHEVNDWALDYKGKGWGPLKFIDRASSFQSGFMVNGCIRIGAEIDGEPFE